MKHLHYDFSWQRANTQLIDICLHVENNTEAAPEFCLPAWRPGRYELGNFAKNIRGMQVEDLSGNALQFEKLSKDRWRIEAGNTTSFRIRYQYYAADLNAGSSFLDTEQLYVNPVNCCVYLPKRMEEPCSVKLNIPEHWQLACDLPRGAEPTLLLAHNFDRLADAPWIASPSLQHRSFSTRNHTFHLWFQGVSNPPWEKLLRDFEPFCAAQLDAMGPLPAPEFHFLFQILPNFFYHGVEHTQSTVCALGPGPAVFEGSGYDDLLGVSSHELYHAWNVKTLRPADMQPYRFDRENYSRLGWVYEGITTYYGDQYLIRSGVFSADQYFETLNEKLHKHFANYGRFNQSVAEASFDTWLDGYVAGIPHRKTSIYTEGSLIALLLDVAIRKHSGNQRSLDDFMRRMLAQHLHYTREHIIEALTWCGLDNAAQLYAQLVEGRPNLEPLLQEAFAYLGMEIYTHKHLSEQEHRSGMLLSDQGGWFNIGWVAPESPAELAGLQTGDTLVALNGEKLSKAANRQWTEAMQTDSCTLHFFHEGRLRETRMHWNTEHYFLSRKARLQANADAQAIEARKAWAVNL